MSSLPARASRQPRVRGPQVPQPADRRSGRLDRRGPGRARSPPRAVGRSRGAFYQPSVPGAPLARPRRLSVTQPP